MGADVSKPFEHNASASAHRLGSSSRSGSRCVSKDVRPLTTFPYRSPTQPVFECTVDEWRSGFHSRLGFDDNVLTCYNRLDYDCSHSFCINRGGILSATRSHAPSPKASSASCPADCVFASSTPQLPFASSCPCASSGPSCVCSSGCAYCNSGHQPCSSSAAATGNTDESFTAHCDSVYHMPAHPHPRKPKAASFTEWVYLRKRRRVSRMAEHFEYNHLPAYLSSIENFHVKSVLCARGSLVILHLECNVFSQFGVVDLRTNAFHGVFGRQSATFETDAIYGDVSPDLNRCLVRLPIRPRNNVLTLNTGSNNFSSVPHILQLYDLHSKDLLYQINLQTNMAMFAFDPRFVNSRIAITNFERNSVNSMSLINLNTCETRVTNPRINDQRSALHPYLRSLLYTPDGFYLIAIITDAECHCRQQRRYRALFHEFTASVSLGTSSVAQVTDNRENLLPSADSHSQSTSNRVNLGTPLTSTCYVLHADTLAKLYALTFDRYLCGLHLCSANFTPLFSACASKMALVRHVASPNGALAAETVHVFRLPPVVSRLQALCRIAIRQNYDEAQLQELVMFGRLPRRLVDFLLFKPTYTCAGSCLSLCQPN